MTARTLPHRRHSDSHLFRVKGSMEPPELLLQFFLDFDVMRQLPRKFCDGLVNVFVSSIQHFMHMKKYIASHD